MATIVNGTKKVPLNSIELDDESQNRAADHDPKKITSFKQSIEDVGLETPLDVEERNGKYYLVNGNHRYKALLQLYNASRSSKTNPWEVVEVKIVKFSGEKNTSVESERRTFQIHRNKHQSAVSTPNGEQDWIRHLVAEARDPRGRFGTVNLQVQTSVDQLKRDMMKALRKEIKSGPLNKKQTKIRIMATVFDDLQGLQPTCLVKRYEQEDVKKLAQNLWPQFTKFGEYDPTTNQLIARVTENDYSYKPVQALRALSKASGFNQGPWEPTTMPEVVFVATVNVESHEEINKFRKMMVREVEAVNQFVRNTMKNLECHKFASLYLAPQKMFPSHVGRTSETKLQVAV